VPLRRPPAPVLCLALLGVTAPAWARAPRTTPPTAEPTSTEAPRTGADAPSPSAPNPPPPVDTTNVAPPAVAAWVEAPWPEGAPHDVAEVRVPVQITLDAAGVLLDARVITPVGAGFDEAALEAVQGMRFTPAMTPTGPVGGTFGFDYVFVWRETQVDVAAAPALTGRLTDADTAAPIAGATVTIAGLNLSVDSDDDGRFAFLSVPAGTWTLLVSPFIHRNAQLDVTVVEGRATDVAMQLQPLETDANVMVVVAERPKVEVTERTLTMTEVRKVPGTFGDPVKVIQTLPGAARSPFGTGLLIIRGANPEDTAVYVDGIRIPIIYHLTGTTSVLNPDAVQAVDYLPGGYGVQFGRSTAGTVNVRSKTTFADKRLIWSTDILDTQLWFEGNVGKDKKHGIAAGIRRSYIDAFIPIFTKNQGISIRPIYWDYQAKWIPKLDNGDTFEVFVYGFQDVVTLESDADRANGTDASAQGGLATLYQSHRVVARYEHDVSDTLHLLVQPSFGIDTVKFGVGNAFGLDNQNIVPQLRAELSWRPTPKVEVVPGLDFIGGPYRFDFRSSVSFADLDDPLAEKDPVGFDGKGTAWSPDVYVKTVLRPFDDPEQMIVTAGVRYSGVTYVIGGGVTFGQDLEPTYIGGFEGRAALRWRTFTKGPMKGTLKASTGWYTQPPQPFESIGLGTANRLVPERAWNSSLGFEHKLNQALSWDLDTFYRKMDRLVEFNDGFTGRGTQTFANTGQGWAAGFEVILRHQPVNHFFGWISYTFSRSFRRDGSADSDGVWYPFDFDQPHIFSAQGGYEFPKGFGLSLQVQAVSGNPTTRSNASIYDVDGDFYNSFQIGSGNSDRLPPFVQTSVRVDKTWKLRIAEVELYLDLINALRGVNPEATVYNYDSTEYAYVRGLPFIPNLGFEVRFWP
jgi:TonB family protein